MADRIIVIIAFATLTAFCGLVIVYVAVPDLAIITMLILALAANDFWISLLKPRTGVDTGQAGSLESRPTGVSGKPLQKKNTPAGKKTAKK